MTPLSDGTPAHMYGANKDSVCRSHLFCRRCYTAPKDGLFLYRPDGACNNVNSYLPVQFTLQLLHSSKPPICTGRPTEHCCVYMAEQNYWHMVVCTAGPLTTTVTTASPTTTTSSELTSHSADDTSSTYAEKGVTVIYIASYDKFV